jgi:hypothetical protein
VIAADAHPELKDSTVTPHSPGLASTWRALRAAGLIHDGGWCHSDEVQAMLPLYEWRRYGRGPELPVEYGRRNVQATLAWLARKGYAERILWEGPTFWRAL